MLNQRRNAVAVFAIGEPEVAQHPVHGRQAHGVGPGQRAAGVVDALTHGHIHRGGITHPLVHCIGRFIGQHDHRAHENEAGEITEGTFGNIAALVDGRWVTPPLSSGLLPGVGRALALREGRVAEAVLRVEDAPRVEAWAFVNSLRGWLAAELE